MTSVSVVIKRSTKLTLSLHRIKQHVDSAGIQNLVPGLKCLNSGGNYVEKELIVCTSTADIHG